MTVQINSPYNVKQVLMTRNYKGYIYRRELIDQSEYGLTEDMEMVCCYTPETGEWIGDSKTTRFLTKKNGLTQIQKTDPSHSVCSIGFNEKEQKWYGWSHRAIFGFGIGSTCVKGDAHYIGSSLKEQEDAAIEFWKSDTHKNVRCHRVVEENGETYFDIKWEYSNDVPNEKIRGTISGCLHHIEDLGKGEWTAETMEDAKQMAIDFANGVS